MAGSVPIISMIMAELAAPPVANAARASPCSGSRPCHEGIDKIHPAQGKLADNDRNGQRNEFSGFAEQRGFQGIFFKSSSQTCFSASLGARQSLRGDREPPEPTLGPLGTQDRLN